jgi:hypothetical protein
LQHSGPPTAKNKLFLDPEWYLRKLVLRVNWPSFGNTTVHWILMLSRALLSCGLAVTNSNAIGTEGNGRNLTAWRAMQPRSGGAKTQVCAVLCVTLPRSGETPK